MDSLIFDAPLTSASSSAPASAEFTPTAFGSLTPVQDVHPIQPQEAEVHIQQAPKQTQAHEKHQQELATKKAEATKEVDEMKQNAATFLEEEKAQRERVCEARRKRNKEAEGKDVAARDQLLESGNDWERVAVLCDLSKRSNPGTQRMRDLLASLKTVKQ